MLVLAHFVLYFFLRYTGVDKTSSVCGAQTLITDDHLVSACVCVYVILTFTASVHWLELADVWVMLRMVFIPFSLDFTEQVHPYVELSSGHMAIQKWVKG